MIGQALRAQARSLSGDVVLLGTAVAALVLSLSSVTSVPPDIADAPDAVRAAFAGSFGIVLATYGAVLAAVYGSFRYTVDRRDGVIAQRLTMQPRWAVFVARLPASLIGGAIVALAGAVGGQIALQVSLGGVPVGWSTIVSTVAVGALAGLWGLGLGIVVQAHLLALFVAAMSMSGALLLAMVWGAGAVYLPPLVMLDAVGMDVGAVGIAPDIRPESGIAGVVSAGWVLAALLAGWLSFSRRDVTS